MLLVCPVSKPACHVRCAVSDSSVAHKLPLAFQEAPGVRMSRDRRGRGVASRDCYVQGMTVVSISHYGNERRA